MAEPIRSRWLDWKPENPRDPQEATRQNLQNPRSRGFVGFVRADSRVSRNPNAPARLLNAAWQRASEAAAAGFRERGTEPDHATFEAAAFLELDLAEGDPNAGCRTAHRQRNKDTVRQALDDLYAGRAVGLVERDGTVAIRSRCGSCE